METIIDTLTLPLNNARFHLGDVPNAWQAWYEDNDWESVTLPHDWSVHMPFSKEYSSGTGYLAGGIDGIAFILLQKKHGRKNTSAFILTAFIKTVVSGAIPLI